MIRCSVFWEIFGLFRRFPTGLPAYETKTKLRNVERNITGML